MMGTKTLTVNDYKDPETMMMLYIDVSSAFYNLQINVTMSQDQILQDKFSSQLLIMLSSGNLPSSTPTNT